MPEMVTIQTREGPVMWSAEIVGPFAIHETAYIDPDDGGAEWTITHRATGYAVTSTLPDACCARQLAERLAELDWSFNKPGDAPAALRHEVYKRISQFFAALERAAGG